VDSALVAIAAIRTVERDVTRRDDATPRKTSLAGMYGIICESQGQPNPIKGPDVPHESSGAQCRNPADGPLAILRQG
jgi:hypothetical protein